MKILFFLGFPNPFPGAGWSRVGFFASYCAKKEDDVVVLGGFSIKTIDKVGVRNEGNTSLKNLVFTLDLGNPVSTLFNIASSFITSTVFLLFWKPKAIIVTLPRGDVGLGCIAAAVLLKKKAIIDYCDEWEDYETSSANSRITKLFLKFVKRLAACFYRHVSVVACVTPNIRRSLVKRGIRDAILIPNGADTGTFKPIEKRRNSKEFRIFFSGFVGGYYRVDLLIKALKQIKNDMLMNMKLTIAGQGETPARIVAILALASGLGLRHCVEYVGAIHDKKRLSEMLAYADVGIIPYDDNPLWKNTIPLKFLEYCACGLPVVATAYEDSFLAELVRQNRIGLICKPNDVWGLAEAIERMFKDKDFRENAGKRARLLVLQSYDMNRITADLFNIVRKVAES